MREAHITISDPGDPMGLPVFDGPVSRAGVELEPGRYAGTETASTGAFNPVWVKVGVDGTVELEARR